VRSRNLKNEKVMTRIGVAAPQGEKYRNLNNKYVIVPHRTSHAKGREQHVTEIQPHTGSEG
jgi:hypothetical protein